MNETPTLPGFGKRILSHTLDLFVVFLTGFLLFASVTSTLFFKAIGGASDGDKAFRFLGDSGLFSITENDGFATGYAAKSYTEDVSSATDSAPAQTEPGYVLYLHDCYQFYVSFLPSDSRVSPVTGSDGSLISAKDYYTPTYFYTSVMGLPDPATVTVSDEASRAGNNPYFMYALTPDNSAIDLTAEPVRRNDATITLKNLKEYFYVYSETTGDSGLFVTAVNLTFADPYYSSNLLSMNLKLWASFALAVAPLIVLDFLVLPLVDKKGRTVGKMITGLAVVDSNGARLRGWHKVFHPLLMSVEVLLALIYPLGIGLMVFMFVSVVDYTSSVVSKSHLSFHEKIARTLVIDFRASSKHRTSEAGKKGTLTPALPEINSTEEDVLDLDGINKRRSEAESLTDFDEYEKKDKEPSSQAVTAEDKPGEAESKEKPSEAVDASIDPEKK